MGIIPEIGPGAPHEELSRQLAAIRDVNGRLAEDPWKRDHYGAIFGSSGEAVLDEWISQLTGNLRYLTAAMPDAEGFTIQVGPTGVSVAVTFRPAEEQ